KARGTRHRRWWAAFRSFPRVHGQDQPAGWFAPQSMDPTVAFPVLGWLEQRPGHRMQQTEEQRLKPKKQLGDGLSPAPKNYSRDASILGRVDLWIQRNCRLFLEVGPRALEFHGRSAESFRNVFIRREALEVDGVEHGEHVKGDVQ